MTEDWLDYGEFLRRLYKAPTYVAEMPDEYFRSRPLPTRRWTVAGFASFGAGCRRRPGQAVFSPPSRWIVADATTARTVIYATTSACSFTDQPFDQHIAGASGLSLPEARARTARIDELLGLLSPRFFDGAAHDGDLVRELGTLLTEEAGGLLEWHRHLVPDFFTWLQP